MFGEFSKRLRPSANRVSMSSRNHSTCSRSARDRHCSGGRDHGSHAGRHRYSFPGLRNWCVVTSFAAVLENVQDSGTSHMLIIRFGIMVTAVSRRIAQIEIVEQYAHARQAGEVTFLGTLTASVHVVNLEHHAQDSYKPPEPDAIFHKDQIHLQGPSDALKVPARACVKNW